MEKITIEQLIIDESFVNYCLSTNKEDILYWTSWQKEHPTEHTVLKEAKQMVLLLHNQPSTVEFESERSRIKRFIEKDTPVVKIYHNKWKSILTIAATLLFLIGASLFTYTIYTESATNSEDELTWIDQQVPAKKTLALTLTDGTKVTLSPSSKFSYPLLFSDTVRQVKLDGNAFFDVNKQLNKPFIITTADLQIKVLGTNFNLEAFDEDETIRLALFSGRVAVSAKGLYQEINPGTKFSYNKTNGEIALSSFNINEKSEMPINSLNFTNATYQEVVEKISRHYGVVFQSSSTVNIDFSGRFFEESLETILSSLNYTTGYHFTLKANTIFVNKK